MTIATTTRTQVERKHFFKISTEDTSLQIVVSESWTNDCMVAISFRTLGDG